MGYLQGLTDYFNKLTQNGKLKYTQNAPLRDYSTFKIGGMADFVLSPSDEEVLLNIVSTLKNFGVHFDVIGNGSNVLFSDDGYRGALIFTGGLKSISSDGSLITAQAGVPLTYTAVYALKNSLCGLEFAYGIPGSVGGAVFMNAGAYGGEMSQIVKSTRYYDCVDGIIKTLDAESHAFDYRKSFFSQSDRNNIILSTQLLLSVRDPDQIKIQMDQNMASRNVNQPLEYPSAGSVFKRCQGHYTGRMIEEAGLKGISIGGAQVSEKHAGFIINRGNASASDVLTLIDIIKQRIHELFGVELECEIRYID